jgi:hypothetical protein
MINFRLPIPTKKFGFRQLCHASNSKYSFEIHGKWAAAL